MCSIIKRRIFVFCPASFSKRWGVANVGKKREGGLKVLENIPVFLSTALETPVRS